MGKYYKIPPEWAKRLNAENYAPEHPDGWRLIMPPLARQLTLILAPKDNGEPWDIDEAVEAIGGVVYTEQEAIASQRGVEAFMMNRNSSPAQSAIYNTDGSLYGQPVSLSEQKPDAGKEVSDGAGE